MLKVRKWLNFPTLPLIQAPARGNPLECRDEIRRQKTGIVELPDGVEITMPARDGRTDRHVTIAKKPR